MNLSRDQINVRRELKLYRAYLKVDEEMKIERKVRELKLNPQDKKS